MWERIKFILSGIGDFLWPLLQQALIASAPIVKAAALAAVQITVAKYANTIASNTEKHDDAYSIVIAELEKQGLKMGQDFTESLIDQFIAAAVKQVSK